jgi:hypothetical protein
MKTTTKLNKFYPETEVIFMFKRINVGYNELALVFKNRDLHNTLDRGTHIITNILGVLDVRIYDTTNPRIKDDDLLRFANHPVFAKFLERRDVRDDQRLIVWQHNRVSEILPGGTYFFWKAKENLNLELITMNSPLLTHDRLSEIFSSGDSWTHLRKVTVKNHEKGLLYSDGQYSETLEPGAYAVWSGASRVDVQKVDMRSKQVTLTIGEAFTSDGIEVKVKIGLSFKAIDPLAYFETYENVTSELQRKAQAISRGIIGKHPVSMILENTSDVTTALKNALIGQRLGSALEVTDFQILDVATDDSFKHDLASEASETMRAKGSLIKDRVEIERLNGLSNISGSGLKIKLAEVAASAISQTRSVHVGDRVLSEILSGLREKDKVG